MAEEEKGFVIKDKRAFSSETGEPTPEASTEAEEEKEAEDTEEGSGEAASAAEEGFQLPEVNFATFVFSLSSSAILHFGEIPDPATGAKNTNLPMAKHTIDILGMLEEKTKGNLTEDESQLLKNILYDLRMRYVKATT
ncbi:MAG: DUF1844 domain-containing protein [Thermodesulfobacteriota bacterium]|nr:DUF1844 domain-containing protein [Thermodesulfobacteriota bacterium]